MEELDGKEVRIAAACALAVWTLAAQETPTFRAETSLALVRFYAAKSGHFVENLTRDDFVLLEDGKPREFIVFEGGGRQRSVPLEVALVFDASGSVTDNGLLDAAAFKAGLLDSVPNARIAVYSFARHLRRYTPPTRDFTALKFALASIAERRSVNGVEIALELPPKRKTTFNGASWIYEAVMGAARDLATQPASATRMIVIFSDGLPTTSTSPQDAASVCEELGISVYPVLLGHWKLGEKIREHQQRDVNRAHPGPPSEAAERLNSMEREIQEFAALGRLTGGSAIDPPAVGPTMLRQLIAGLAGRARSEYVLGFTPESSGAPRSRKLEVRLRDKSLGQIMGGKRQIVH